MEGVPFPPVDEAIKASMESYLAFAWDKTADHRGLSARRSIDKLKAYLFMLEDDELLGKIEREEIPYPRYGAPILHAISAKYGLYVPAGEEVANMIAGKPCRPDCQEGCL